VVWLTAYVVGLCFGSRSMSTRGTTHAGVDNALLVSWFAVPNSVPAAERWNGYSNEYRVRQRLALDRRSASDARLAARSAVEPNSGRAIRASGSGQHRFRPRSPIIATRELRRTRRFSRQGQPAGRGTRRVTAAPRQRTQSSNQSPPRRMRAGVSGQKQLEFCRLKSGLPGSAQLPCRNHAWG